MGNLTVWSLVPFVMNLSDGSGLWLDNSKNFHSEMETSKMTQQESESKLLLKYIFFNGKAW